MTQVSQSNKTTTQHLHQHGNELRDAILHTDSEMKTRRILCPHSWERRLDRSTNTASAAMTSCLPQTCHHSLYSLPAFTQDSHLQNPTHEMADSPVQKEESPAQRQARLRREKRNARIVSEGSDRLAKISQLSGRPPPAPEDGMRLFFLAIYTANANTIKVLSSSPTNPPFLMTTTQTKSTFPTTTTHHA